MTERPILFNAEMVKAILEGRKTQTRRVIKPKSKALHDNNVACIVHRESGDKWYQDHVFSMRGKHGVWEDYTLEGFLALCPFGQVGGRLWVRETFCMGRIEEDDNPFLSYPKPLYVDNYEGKDAYPIYKQMVIKEKITHEDVKWTPSIHMPRSASRILLEITSIRVERLNDISRADAVKEGIETLMVDCSRDGLKTTYKDYTSHNNAITRNNPIDSFRTLWESVNGADSWGKSPWVWVIDFKVAKVGGRK